MATPTNIVKFLVRRGSDEDRLSIKLAEGELGYTTNAPRLFVGDGVTTGGNPVASKLHIVSNFNQPYTNYVVPGDIVYNTSDNHLYALTGTNSTLSANYVFIGR